MHPSSVDIDNEFSDIAVEVAYLSDLLARLHPGEVPADLQIKWEATLVCASATEKVYTGCERVMARIAADLDGVPVSRSEGWHVALLRRLAAPYSTLRGPILSAECYAGLDRLRAFRHRERNTYGINLDFGIVVDRAREAVAAFAMFRREITTFLARSDGDEEAGQDGRASNPGPP